MTDNRIGRPAFSAPFISSYYSIDGRKVKAPGGPVLNPQPRSTNDQI